MPEANIMTAFAVIFPLGVLTILTAFHLLLYLAYRQERSNLFFVFLALILVVNNIASGLPTLIALPSWVLVCCPMLFRISSSITGLALVMAMYSTVQQHFPKRLYWLVFPVIFLSLLNAFFPNSWSPAISFVIVAVLLLEVSRTAFRSISAALPGAWILALGTFLFLCISLFYWITRLLNVKLNELEMMFFTLSDMLVMPVTMALWTSVRFALTNKNLELQTKEVQVLSEAMLRQEQEKREIIEQQNYELERLVQERTRQLEEKVQLLFAANEEIQKQVAVQVQQSSEIQVANALLQEQNERLTELNNEKNEFLGIVAHDLKNPLGNIMMLTDMARGKSIEIDEQHKKQALELVILTSKKMYTLIENLLDWNKIEQGNFRLEYVEIDLAAKIDICIKEFRQQATLKEITIICDFEYDNTKQFCVLADSIALEEILENVISNAIKYSPFGTTVIIEIHKSFRQDGEFLLFSVKDQGPGLSAEELPLLFRKFVRLSPQPTAGENSTGLGLSIVKRLVEAMNGRVWCESVQGVGSTFFVELPAVPVARGIVS
jgi:signal transduction histidine kinase